MSNIRPLRLTMRLLGTATMIGWLGGAIGFAQGLPRMPGMPAMPGTTSASGLAQPPGTIGTSVSGYGLGNLQFRLGLFAPIGALGTLAPCPIVDVGGSASTPAMSPVPVTTGSGLSPIITVPTTTPQSVAPTVGSAMAPTIASSTVTSTTAPPPLLTPPIATPPLTSPFGTLTIGGVCTSTVLSEPPTPPPSSTTLTGVSYSNAAIPLNATEVGTSGLSPTIDVPPPALFGDAAPPQ